MLIKKRMFLLLSPCHPEAQTWGFVGFSAWYRPRISDELLPGFRTVITLMPGVPSGHPRTFSLLPFGPKMQLVAPGETLSNFARTSQTPVSCTAPSLLQYMALSVLCPALYSLDRKRSAWFWGLGDSREPVWIVCQAAGDNERAESLDSGTISSNPNSGTDFVTMGNMASVIFIHMKWGL